MAIMRTVMRKLHPHLPLTTSDPSSDSDRYKALETLCAQRQLLSVAPEGDESSYQSIILAVDVERGLLWLDDLFPGEPSLRPGARLEVSHHHNGDLLQFRSPVVALGKRFGTSGLALLLPDSAHYRPRRQWPRLSLEGRPPVSVKLALPDVEPQHAQLLNISAGGVRVALSGDWVEKLRHNDVLPLCELTLAPGLTARCQARVCAFNTHYRPWRQTHISLAFVGLNETAALGLHHYISASLAANLDLRAA